MKLENESISIEFDELNGSILSLFNKKTNLEFIRQPKLGRGLRLLVPTDKKRNNKALTEAQKDIHIKKVGNEKVTFTWNSISTNHAGLLPIRVEMVITLQDSSLTFGITIENKSPFVVEEVWSPSLGGIREPKGTEPFMTRTVTQIAGFHTQKLGDGFHSWGYFGTSHPTTIATYPGTHCQLPFMLLTHENQGIYLGCHAPEVELVSFITELLPGYGDSYHAQIPKEDEIAGSPVGFVVSVAQLPCIQPGETKTLSPTVLSFFEGTWHKGIDIYKTWRNSWFKKRPQPFWLAEVDCWMTLQMNSSEGCYFYQYKDLPGIMAEAKNHGVQALQLIGWAIGGQDGLEPIQDTDPLLGTKEELKEAIQQIEAMGIRVLLMAKFKWADISLENYKEDLLLLTMKDMQGNPTQFGGYSYQTIAQHLQGASRRSGTGLCHLSKEYRSFALQEFKKLVDLGASGLLYDELSSDLLICFDQSHGHPWGESAFKGSLLLAKEFYEAAREVSSEFLLAGEGVIDPIAQYYAINYMRSSAGTWGGPNYTPVWKYMDSDMKFATCLIGFDDREMVNQCIAQGHIINYEADHFKSSVTQMPITTAYGIKAQSLRKTLWDYLWNGTYLDTLGAEVIIHNSIPDTSDILYSVFEHKEQKNRAYVIANQGSTMVEVTLKPTNLHKEFMKYEIEGSDPAKSAGSELIEPRSLLVLVEV